MPCFLIVLSGLKSHAVTLYEVGKLGHASIADLCKDLSTLEGTKFEGELQEFANHAFSLRCVLECLQSGGVATDVKAEEVCNKMGMYASSNDEATLIADITLTDKPGNSDIKEPWLDKDESASSGMHLEGSVLTESACGSNGDEIFSAISSEDKNCKRRI